MGAFHFFARRRYLHTALLPRKAKIIPFLIILNIKCLEFQGIFLFRFLLSRGIYIHLPSQENEIQLHLSIYVRSPEKSKNHIPFINFILLFRRGELCSPLCFCFKKSGRIFRPLLVTFQSHRDSNSRRVFQAGRTHPQGIPHLEKHCTGLALSSCTLCQEYKNHMQEWSFAHLFPFE